MTSTPTSKPAANLTKDRYLIISADCHAGLPSERYRPYLDEKYLPAFDDFLGERSAAIQEMERLGLHNKKYAEQWFEEHGEGLEGGWNVEQRDKELDADGVAGEVLFPDSDAVLGGTSAPFGAGLGLSGAIDPELAMAGARAHNRWLAELCSVSPERRAGIALVPIHGDVDASVAEIRRAKESGLAGIMIPAMWVDHAPYHDTRYDPIWATCEELEMPVHTHSGSAPKEEYGEHNGMYVTEVWFWAARPLWFLMWSGVFERFGGLRFVVTESGAWWVGNLLWFWDNYFARTSGGAQKMAGVGKGMTMLPSEYFDRNCAIGASTTKRRELALRYEIGVENIMWGNDFPHPEGTWPDTRNWLRTNFGDVPIDESRQMLGLNAAATYGFDPVTLQPLANRIGPTPVDLGQDDAGANGTWTEERNRGRHWISGADHRLPAVVKRS